MELSAHQIKMLEAIAKVTPSYIVRKYKGECCIAATRIIIEVLKKLHFKDVKPFVVEASIFNEVYVKKGRTPQSSEEAQSWLGEGAWEVVLGERTEKNEGKWPGHLAVLINNKYIFDIAAFQATRPEKKIYMEPIFTTVPEGFVQGEDQCGLMFNNCLVVYKSYPQDKSYQSAKDWSDLNKSKDIVSEIYSEVKAALKG